MGTEKEIVAEGKGLKKQFKKQYQTPQLIIHGTIEKITGNVGDHGYDKILGSRL